MSDNRELRSKDSLKVQALTQRIATLVAQYEEQIADLRADATITIETLSAALDEARAERDAAVTEFTDYKNEIQNQNEVPEAPSE